MLLLDRCTGRKRKVARCGELPTELLEHLRCSSAAPLGAEDMPVAEQRTLAERGSDWLLQQALIALLGVAELPLCGSQFSVQKLRLRSDGIAYPRHPLQPPKVLPCTGIVCRLQRSGGQFEQLGSGFSSLPTSLHHRIGKAHRGTGFRLPCPLHKQPWAYRCNVYGCTSAQQQPRHCAPALHRK